MILHIYVHNVQVVECYNKVWQDKEERSVDISAYK